MDFLLAHYSDLNLLYPFPVSLSYIASPLLMEGTAVLCFDDEDQLSGAFGYIHGTGEQDYKDRHVIQLQVAYIVEHHRSTRMFYEALQFLVSHLSDQEEERVEEIRFWIPGEPRTRRLCSRFADLLSTVDQTQGCLDEYRINVKHLQKYVSTFGTRSLA
ncbi:hypothetical protein HII30_07115 [Paenibacillus lemnae]|uniref:Uncharacterized protein n=2 Tax=Paenibacillus lemnae TaxID=1330551 RepID=A0A848M443_PAELE|nr:hypothetical protein [Paenibacillus lemnae]